MGTRGHPEIDPREARLGPAAIGLAGVRPFGRAARGLALRSP